MYLTSDSFEIMKPFILVTRCFGLCPLTYEKKGSNYQLNKSFKFILYSYFLAFGLVTMTFIGVMNDLDQDEKKSNRMKSKKTRYITCCDISVVIVLVLYAVLSTPFKIKNFWKLLQCFNTLDSVLPLDNVKQHKNNSRNFIILILALFSIIIIFDMSVWSTLSKKNHTHLTFWKDYWAFYLLYYIVIMQEIYFCHLVYFVRIRLTSLNKALQNEAKSAEQLKLRHVEDKPFVQPAVANDLILKNARFRDNFSSSAKVFFNKLNTADKIISYSQVYEKLWEAVDHINEYVGFGIIIILLSCLLHLIVTPYFLLYEISNNGSAIFISLQSVWLFTHASRLLMIVEPCHQCLKESWKTINFVCEILTFTKNNDTRSALSVFAMQLSYCKIRFHTCGLVRIERSLITAVVGAVTTYLVILFQFNNV